jgi:hypothetical protein
MTYWIGEHINTVLTILLTSIIIVTFSFVVKYRSIIKSNIVKYLSDSINLKNTTIDTNTKPNELLENSIDKQHLENNINTNRIENSINKNHLENSISSENIDYQSMFTKYHDRYKDLKKTNKILNDDVTILKQQIIQLQNKQNMMKDIIRKLDTKLKHKNEVIADIHKNTNISNITDTVNFDMITSLNNFTQNTENTQNIQNIHNLNILNIANTDKCPAEYKIYFECYGYPKTEEDIKNIDMEQIVMIKRELDQKNISISS